MEHSVQINPEKCVLVMGPQMAAEALSLSEGVPAALSYAMLINIGIQKILDLDKSSNSAEKSRKHALMVNAYELEPAFAAHKIVETLRENNVYKEWLVELFGSLPSLYSMSSSRQKQGGSMVEKLSSLHEKGMLLVYTHYDTILDVQMGTAPVLLGDEEAVRSWAASQTRGLLHVHGMFSKPDSVSYDCVDYRRLVGETPGGQILKDVFRARSVIFAGFDGEFYDPFLPKFARTFLSQEHPPPLLLSAAPKVTNLTEAFLNLKVTQLAQLDRLLIPQAPAAYLGTSRDCVENKLTTTLLYVNKVSCLDAAERVKVTSAVNVHQLTMRHERLHHHLLLYLDRDGLKELWRLIFAVASPSQPGLHTGLLGVVLDDVITVWLNGGMAAQQEQHVSLAMSSHVEGPPGIRDQYSLHLATPHSSQPPSLSTNVAVIGSTWTPIPAPSISRPLSTASISTSSARIGHPSPLVSSTSRTSLGTVATRGPMSEAQMSLLSQRPHNQVRRVKSEYLMYKDRLVGKQAVMRNRNGLLLHRESAPEFVQTSEGLVAYPSNPSSLRERSGILIGQPRPAPPSHHYHHMQPSPLVKGGVHMEVKIECVDTQHHGHATPHSAAPISATHSGSGGPAHLIKKESFRPSEGCPPASGSGVVVKEFNEEKQKFIMEAQTWSKQVDSDLAKKLRVTSSASSSTLLPPCSSSSVSRAYPLGFLGAHQLAAAQPSLTSKFSLEEQEKFLKQHFEQIVQQQQQLFSVAGMPLPVISPAKSPMGGASLPQSSPSPVASSTPVLSHGHSRQPSSTSLTAPLQAQSSSAAVASPKKTSPLGLLPPNPPGGSAPLSMFPFLPTSAAAAPGLLCNPSLPQFPMAAAAMFNPMYQATLQKLVKGGQIAALPDPALLQGLVDKVPVFLPDGRITFVPLGSSVQQGNGDSSPSKDDVEEDEDEEEEEEEEEKKEDTLKSPLATGSKRMRSPVADARALFRSVPPKRRRSSSLPDINQLLHISPRKKFREEEKDGELSKEKGSINKKSNGITGVMATSALSGSPRPRQQAPPTMIHIPQDMKMGDPMLGFPTPPQSSPLRGGFSLSPVILPSAQFHHHQAAQHPHQPMTPVTPGHDSLHTTDELRELMEAGELTTTLPPSPEGSSLPPFPAGRGPIQLWQFLLDLLLSPDKQHMIHWTGNGYEFCILLPEDIAKLWGARKNKPRMNYDKLSRGLRYYYNKGIMDKVQGKKLTFKYTCDVHNYIRSRNAQAHGASTPHVSASAGGEYRSGSSTPVLMQPMSDGAPEGDDVGDEGIMGIAGDRGRLYGATSMGSEMELAPPPEFQHGLKKSNEVFNETEGSRCDYQGLMGVVKGYGVLGVVDQDNHSNSPARLHGGLCSEAV